MSRFILIAGNLVLLIKRRVKTGTIKKVLLLRIYAIFIQDYVNTFVRALQEITIRLMPLVFLLAMNDTHTLQMAMNRFVETKDVNMLALLVIAGRRMKILRMIIIYKVFSERLWNFYVQYS